MITKNPDAGIVAPITEPDKDFYGLFPEKNTKKKLGPNEIKCQNLLKDSKIEGDICVEVAKGCALLINSDHFEKVGKLSGQYIGRTPYMNPVVIESKDNQIGKILPVKICETNGLSLSGEPVM